MVEPAGKRVKLEFPAPPVGSGTPSQPPGGARACEKGLTENELILRFREACRLNGHSMEDLLSKASGSSRERVASSEGGGACHSERCCFA